MKPQDLQYVPVTKNLDLVTEWEIPGLPEVYALRLKGIRTDRPGTIFDRDPGTIQLYDNYPQHPNPSGAPIDMWRGFYLFDVMTGAQHKIVVGFDIAANFRIYVDDAGWPELTDQVFANISGSPAGNVVTLKYIADALGAPRTLTTNQLAGWTLENTTKGQCALVTASTATTVTLDLTVDGGGLNWASNDALTLHKVDVTLYGAANGWAFAHGDTPHVRWLPVEARRKGYLLTGDSSVPITPNYPVEVSYREERKYFHKHSQPVWVIFTDYSLNDVVTDGSSAYICILAHTASGLDEPGKGVNWQTYWSVTVLDPATPLQTLGAGWYIELAGGLIPNFVPVGSEARPMNSVNGDSSDTTFADPDGNPWLQIQLHVTGFNPNSGEIPNHLKLAVTVVYDDYTESDWILRAYASDTGATWATFFDSVKFLVSFARMPKHISGFRIYTANRAKSATPEFTAWKETAESYGLELEIFINEESKAKNGNFLDWSFDDTTERAYSIETAAGPLGAPFVTPAITLLSELAHVPQDKRSRIKPRFAAHATREQGALIVMDEDDRTLRLTNYNGDKVHEDGNLPNVTTDVSGNALILPITGHGDLMGLAFHRDNVAAVRRGEVEIRDLQSGTLVRIITVDVASKESIDDKGPGLTWAGNSGIWLLPSDGSAERIINPLWRNLYDGRLKTSDGVTPYIGAAQRAAIIGGWDYWYGEKIFLIEVLTDDGESSEWWGMRWNGKTWNIKEMFPKPS